MQPSEQQALGMFVNDYIAEHLETTLMEGVGDVYDGIIFETEQGYSIEFALNQDLDEASANAIADAVFEMFEDCTIEVSGDS